MQEALYFWFVHPSVRPLLRWVTCWLMDSPMDRPTINMYIIHLKGFWALPWNAWKEWCQIWHPDVSWPPSEPIRFWSWAVDFPHLLQFWLSETGKICGFQVFSVECVEGMAYNLAWQIRFWTEYVDFPNFGTLVISDKCWLFNYHLQNYR